MADGGVRAPGGGSLAVMLVVLSVGFPTVLPGQWRKATHALLWAYIYSMERTATAVFLGSGIFRLQWTTMYFRAPPMDAGRTMSTS